MLPVLQKRSTNAVQQQLAAKKTQKTYHNYFKFPDLSHQLLQFGVFMTKFTILIYWNLFIITFIFFPLLHFWI